MRSDPLGDRMKEQYENRTRYFLPRRTYTIIRVDGRAFHTYARGLDKPFDVQFMADMDAVAVALCEGIAGARLAFQQSDEVSVLLADFDTPTTEAWFGGNLQKLASLSASLATATFNDRRPGSLACFDGRAFTIPDPTEVANYYVWRQQDATRNSIQMAAQSKFSQKQMDCKNCNQLQEMLWQEHGINWNDYPVGCKRGRTVARRVTTKPVTYTDKRTGSEVTLPAVERHVWEVEEPPIFTADRLYLNELIPICGVPGLAPPEMSQE